MRLIDAGKIVYMWQIDADGQEHDGVTLQSIINKMPTIEERKVGKWIEDGFFVCSLCGGDAPHDWNYCPHCGARME